MSIIDIKDWYFRQHSINGNGMDWSEHDGSLTLMSMLVNGVTPLPNVPLDSSLTVALYASLLLQSGSSPEYSEATETINSYSEVLLNNGDITESEHIRLVIAISKEINHRWGRNEEETVYAYFVITDFDGYIESQGTANIVEFEGIERETADSLGWLIYNNRETHVGIMVSKTPFQNITNMTQFEYRRQLDGPGIITTVEG